MHILSILFLTLVVSLRAGADAQATKIISEGESKTRGRSTQLILSMKIVRPDFTRELRVRAWTVGDTHALVEILKPPKEEGVVSLRNKSQMWNYLPKTDQVVRVPTSLMLQSWMGSDFTNDDLMKASSLLRDYDHKILKTTKLNGQKVTMVECKPKPDAPVVWGKVLYWARAKDSLPIRQKFYDDRGHWVRTLDFSGFKKMDDREVPTMVRVTKADAPKEYTVVKYHKITYDRKLDSSIFDQEQVRQISFRGKSLGWGWYEARLPKQHEEPSYASPLRMPKR